jgi:hypothetical protein
MIDSLRKAAEHSSDDLTLMLTVGKRQSPTAAPTEEPTAAPTEEPTPVSRSPNRRCLRDQGGSM